jgi:hypothetical protein
MILFTTRIFHTTFRAISTNNIPKHKKFNSKPVIWMSSLFYSVCEQIFITSGKGKGKIIPVQALEALMVVRGWGSHIFQTFGSQMAAKLSALRAGRFLSPGRFLVLIFVRGWVDPRAIVRLEGLGKLKIFTSSGTRNDDLPAYSIVPQPTTLPRAPL